MNTSRAGSNMPCSRIQRRRAWATSARFCSAAYRVFFEADVASIVEPPDRAAAARDAALVHRRNDLVKRQVRLLGDEREQEFRVLFQRRSASATWLCGNASGCFEALRPNHHHTGADPIVFGRRTPRCTADNISYYSGTQVAGIRLGHGIPRHRIKDKRLLHWQAVGNPSDSSRAKFALVGKSDEGNWFDTIAVNAKQNWIDPATGSPRSGIIASLQAAKEEMVSLRLDQVDPKACFRHLKGIATPS